jgi:hypothetical protein
MSAQISPLLKLANVIPIPQANPGRTHASVFSLLVYTLKKKFRGFPVPSQDVNLQISLAGSDFIIPSQGEFYK